MDKIKTLRKLRTSSLNTLKSKNQIKIKKGVKLNKFNPDKYLSKEFIGSAILECLLNNDPKGVIDLLEIYLDEYNKVALLKDANVARSTAYQILKHKNPTIKTLAKIISTIAHID